MDGNGKGLWAAMVWCLVAVVCSTTDPNDFKILSDFREGLENPELLKWPASGSDPCGPPSWPHVFCSGGRVTQIQVQGLGLKGPLPQNLNRLAKLQNLGLQKNEFRGKLPTFSGLSELQFAYLDFNEFDTIPSDFFHGLTSVRVLALDHNPFNASTGWSIPSELQESVQLTNFSCSICNLAGPLPDFFGELSSLTSLRLSYNRLSGGLPESLRDSMLQILWLNDQDGGGMTGTIDVIGSMVSLVQVWLHGNQFTGTIPDTIGALASLRELNLNGNQLVGLIPRSLASMTLQMLNLNNNMLMGPIPKFKASNVTYSSNSFCQPIPGLQCAPEVDAFLGFLGSVNYPLHLATLWTGNDPCKEPWLGLSCNPKGEVSIVNLPKLKLNGTLSPSIANLDSLMEIHLGGNNLSGSIPANLTQLKSLRLLDLSGNNFQPPLPKFHEGVKVLADGNPLLVANQTRDFPSPTGSPLPPSPISSQSPSSPSIIPSPISQSSSNGSSSGSGRSPSYETQPSPSKGLNVGSSSSIQEQSKRENSKNVKLIVIVVVAAVLSTLIVFVILLFAYCYKRKVTLEAPRAIVVHPRDPSDPDNIVKIAVSNNTTGNKLSKTGNSSQSRSSGGVENSHMIEDGNLAISVQILRKVTNNFAPENEVGRGGFGAVYKGELEGGTKIAVKRMEVGVLGNKALDEYEAEIAVLSKVRHRHLVSLLGYSVEGSERLLIYEYMPQGALSRHLFHWKNLNLDPLSWTRRVSIALDVARGMEYLHNLAHQSFIHRDLKSSNILLGDDFRAKVSDFGLVKHAPDREKSVATRLAGTFGYLAPEYAVLGKITTKADVFSYGVVLMELLTGLVALDEHRPEESRYLAEWFWKIKSSRETLIAAIDPALDAKEEIFASIYIIAELAGHCTARDPSHRPDMGHAVNVLATLVEQWKPFDGEAETDSGIDCTLTLPLMLKGWQEAETKGSRSTSLNDSKDSIPARPAGFADSFTSADAR